MTDWTTFADPVREWWRRLTTTPERPAAVAAKEPRALSVPAEYLSLYTYLEDRYASTVVLTFDQMEALLGFALPESARHDGAWWATASVPTHSAAWTDARRTAEPNLPARTVTFERLPDPA